jgi:hypothetical protein
MDFRNMLQSLTSLAEGETKDTKTGRVHKGSYGTSYDGDDDKKEKKPEVKRGRGRPKKDAGEDGEVKKYDTKGLHDVFGGGKKPKKEVGKTSKKHSLKEYIEEVADSKTQLDEAEQITIQPAQQNTQVIKQGNKTLGTVTNPQLAQQIKQSIGKGEMSLAGDELTDEGVMDTMKKAGSAVLNKLGHGSDAELLKKLQKQAGAQNAQVHGKPSMASSNTQKPVTEKAPEGWEGTVKAMKKHKDEIDNPWALAHYMKNKGYKSHKKAEEMTESFKMEDGSLLTEGSLRSLVLCLMDDLRNGPEGYNILPAVEMQDRAKAQRTIDKVLQHGDRYKRLAGTLKGHLRDAALEEFGFTDYDASLEEADTRPEPELLAPVPSKEAFRTTGMDSKLGNPKEFVPSRTQAPAAKPGIFRAAGSVASKLNPFRKLGENKEMKDTQLESWEQHLNSLLNEGITVTSSTGQQGSPDSVSINATDTDAQELLAIVRQAGLGVFGNQEQEVSDYGAPMSTGSEEPAGHGTDPEVSPTVVGDGDDMMALIKKMTGIDTSGSEDYADEEGEETHTLEPADSDESEDDTEEKTDEGNAFTGALAKAKADGVQPGEKMKVGGKEYPVKEEDEVEEGNKFTGNLAKARAAGKKEADLDGDGDMEKVHEGEHTCNECGMYESQCGCEEPVEEGFSNDAGGDAMADTEMAKLKALLSMGNDLHKLKRNQTVGNPTQVAFESQINDWKKLSGL